MSKWNKAYRNTASIKVQYPQFYSYKKVCKNCNSVTDTIPTNDRQIIGNCLQRIEECKDCGCEFVNDLN